MRGNEYLRVDEIGYSDYHIYVMIIIIIFLTEHTKRSDQGINNQALFPNIVLNCTAGNISFQSRKFFNDYSCQSSIKGG